jgi:mono/diheme cytochrome c family protein
LKRMLTLAAACALAFVVSGCAKSTSSEGANATASGPITDVDNSGLKTTAAPAMVMGDPKHGEEIFKQNCASCHGAGGAGGGIGPVLKGEKQRKDYAAAIAWIKNPQPPMPKLFPSVLSQNDVQDVAAYVESL